MLPSTPSTTNYLYDFDRQVASVTYPTSDVIESKFDQNGELVELRSAGGSYQFTPDRGYLGGGFSPDGINSTTTRVGRTIAVESTAGHVVDYHYNTNLQVRRIVVDSLSDVEYFYDRDKLLTGTSEMSMTLDPQNGLVRSTSTGIVSTEHSYNLFGEPSTYVAKVSGVPVFSESYVRDNAGRISSKTVVVNGQSKIYQYVYDTAGRLAQAIENGVVVGQYFYDDNGNRTSGSIRGQAFSAAFDDQDRILSSTGYTYSHNAKDEITAKTGPAGSSSYTYNAFGELKSVQVPGKFIEYKYDGYGRRHSRSVNGVVTNRYIYQNQLQIAAEVGPNDQILARYVYASHSHVPDYMIRDGQVFRFVHDHLGSVRLVLDADSGVVVQKIDYDDWGRVISDTNPTIQPFRFSGCLYDVETDLCRFGARDYDVKLGRWTSKDPILFGAGDANVYAYVTSDPVNSIDPSGLSEQDIRTIQRAFSIHVSKSNIGGYRFPASGPVAGNRLTNAYGTLAGWLNNFWSSMAMSVNTIAGTNFSPYLGCTDQVLELQGQLSAMQNSGVISNDFTFSRGRTGGVFEHHFIVAKSPSDNVILVLDPWKGTITSVPIE